MGLHIPCLCLVTDRKRFGNLPVEEVVAQSAAGGVNMVQLREKDMPAGELFDLCQRVRVITSGKALLIVNDRVDVAIACEADGVQLGEDALTVTAARQIAGDKLIIGRSVHSLEGAIEAQKAGADFLIAGTIFPSQSHPGSVPAGLQFLRALQQKIMIPCLAIGGVTRDNLASVVEAGAWGAAIVGAIGTSPRPKDAAKELRSILEKAWSARVRRIREA